MRIEGFADALSELLLQLILKIAVFTNTVARITEERWIRQIQVNNARNGKTPRYVYMFVRACVCHVYVCVNESHTIAKHVTQGENNIHRCLPRDSFIACVFF